MKGFHMKATLNVGMVKSSDGKTLPSQLVLETVSKFFKIVRAKFAQSATEPTLVAEVEINKSWFFKSYKLAKLLDQDCIAVAFDGQGKLVGPNASSWGEFDPSFFINF